MTEFLSILTHGRRLQGAVKSLTIEELEEVKEKLERIISKQKEKQLEQQKVAEEKRQKIAEIKKQMEELGLDYQDLMSSEAASINESKKKEKTAKRPIKYIITDSAGTEYKWTGIGSMPIVFKDALNRGHVLSDFSVK